MTQAFKNMDFELKINKSENKKWKQFFLDNTLSKN